VEENRCDSNYFREVDGKNIVDGCRKPHVNFGWGDKRRSCRDLGGPRMLNDPSPKRIWEFWKRNRKKAFHRGGVFFSWTGVNERAMEKKKDQAP